MINTKKNSNSFLDIFFKKKKRIAVFLPIEYLGGTLRGAMLIAEALLYGSITDNKEAEIVFAHLENSKLYPDQLFKHLDKRIQRRPFKWKTLSHKQAETALELALNQKEIEHSDHCIPDDGMNYFNDCDIWLFVSDRIEKPLLPIKPYVVMIYDYLQRYFNVIPEKYNKIFLKHAHQANEIWVTTKFTRSCTEEYARIPSQRISLLPMLPPIFCSSENQEKQFIPAKQKPYFLWTTNLAPHKNIERALKALEIYYGILNGKLECYISGVNTTQLWEKKHSQEINIELFKNNLKIQGYLTDSIYQAILKNACFLWHPCQIDNGTFSVLEAAQFGVPSLSSRYPAMEEIAEQFSFSLSWMDPLDYEDMAKQLKKMETEYLAQKQTLPEQVHFETFSPQNLGIHYWRAIKKWL